MLDPPRDGSERGVDRVSAIALTTVPDRQVESTGYESLLDRDGRWALQEGSRHFEEKSAVFDSLHRIAKRLRELGVPYAVVGGLALFRYGVRRFTEDIDILVTKASLKLIHERLEGLGYLPPFRNSKTLRDTDTKVRIEFLTTGGFPGDGKPKPIQFPDPASVAVESDGIVYIDLRSLIELKLASGMTGVGRQKDLSDVLELIKAQILPLEFAGQLDPYVRETYRRLWHETRRRFVLLWRNQPLTAKPTSNEELADQRRQAAEELERMQRDGVVLENRGARDGSMFLVTDDPEVAKKYGMVEEAEFWDPDEVEDESPGGSEPGPNAG